MLFVVVLVVVTLVLGLIDCSEEIFLGGVYDESVSKFSVCETDEVLLLINFSSLFSSSISFTISMGCWE